MSFLLYCSDSFLTSTIDCRVGCRVVQPDEVLFIEQERVLDYHSPQHTPRRGMSLPFSSLSHRPYLHFRSTSLALSSSPCTLAPVFPRSLCPVHRSRSPAMALATPRRFQSPGTLPPMVRSRILPHSFHLILTSSFPDPDLTANIYGGLTSYRVPGPAVWRG